LMVLNKSVFEFVSLIKMNRKVILVI